MRASRARLPEKALTPSKTRYRYMRKNIILITAVVAAVSAGSILRAADFETDLRNIESRLALIKAAPAAEAAGPRPTPADNKWWSVSFFGAAHKKAAKAALEYIDQNAFPDIKSAGDVIKEGSNDESGHFNSVKNGGETKALWFGKEAFFKGGVMRNYEQFKFEEAYEKLGVLCHLTQDQAAPVHAANIKHGISDSFEGFYGNDVRIGAAWDNGEMEPYNYYQAVQDETRSKLPGWTDPATGRPYWVAAFDAPPLGRDVTSGPWGHYGGYKNRDLYAAPPKRAGSQDMGNNNTAWVSARPEIRSRQLAVAGAVTVSVLQSASKRLPPLIRDFSVSTCTFSTADGPAIGYSINFIIYENRSPIVSYTAAVYQDGRLLGIVGHNEAKLGKADKDDLMYSVQFTAGWSGQAIWSDFRRLPPGEYVMDVRVTDADGNTTPEEVNTDDIPSNDTRAKFMII